MALFCLLDKLSVCFRPKIFKIRCFILEPNNCIFKGPVLRDHIIEKVSKLCNCLPYGPILLVNVVLQDSHLFCHLGLHGHHVLVNGKLDFLDIIMEAVKSHTSLLEVTVDVLVLHLVLTEVAIDSIDNHAHGIVHNSGYVVPLSIADPEDGWCGLLNLGVVSMLWALILSRAFLLAVGRVLLPSEVCLRLTPEHGLLLLVF